MTAPSALPGLDAIRGRPIEVDYVGQAFVSLRADERDALVAAVEALAEVSRTRTDLLGAGRDLYAAVPKSVLYQADAALALFRVRDVTAAEVPQKLIDDVRAAGLATAHLGDEVWGGDDEPAPFEERLRRERERRLAAAPWHYWKAAGRPGRPLEERYCDYCAGWFGVPHDNQHREGVCRSAGTGLCACIDCWVYEGRTEAVRS